MRAKRVIKAKKKKKILPLGRRVKREEGWKSQSMLFAVWPKRCPYLDPSIRPNQRDYRRVDARTNVTAGAHEGVGVR